MKTYDQMLRRRAINAKWRRANPEARRAQWRRWAKRNREAVNRHIRRWQKQNPEKQRLYCARWRARNPIKVYEKNARRRARKHDACVPGAGQAISKIYARRDFWSRLGFKVEVDHIYPLGFGWHEPANLQIILASDNRAKRADPDYVPSIIFS